MEETLLENEQESEAPLLTEQTEPETEPISESAEDAAEAIEDKPDALTNEDYERIAKEDLDILKSQFPALAGLASLGALQNPVRYAELRELGLSPAEAYLATGGAPRKRSDNRAHLRSAVPRIGALGSATLSSEQMAEARRLFSDLSDAQIHRLFKKVTN